MLIRMEGNTSLRFHETERRHHPSTHPKVPGHNKTLYVYTDASDDACRAQLSQMHEEAEFPVAFLSHTFTDTQ